MHIKGLCTTDLKRPVKVFDIANKKLIGSFDSLTAAGEFTGVNTSSVRNYAVRKNKCFKNKLNITLAFR